MNEWVALIIGLAGGGAVVAFWMLFRRAKLQAELSDARARAMALEATVEGAMRDMESVRRQRDEHDQRREAAVLESAQLKERLQQRDQQFAEQKKLLEDMEKRFIDTFRSIGSSALQANNAQFIELARATFETLMKDAKGDVEKKQQAIDALVKPIRELLERQTTALTEIEKKRLEDKTGLQEQLKQVAEAHRNLSQETGQLVKALRRPEQRGRWGEVQLRNCVELAGMTHHCDFVEQQTIGAPGERLRPDMLINLPGEGLIVVDSKVALDAYLDAIECRDDEGRAECLRRHAKQVSSHVDALRNKAYWAQAETLGKRAPKLVVMFVPLESALVAALEVEPELHSSAMQKDVLIATPTLLVALLRAVAYGWRQEDVAANAKDIADAGRELYSRLSTFADHLEGVGKSLNAAGSAYDKAIGSLESRVLPTARELKQLNVTTEPDIEAPKRLQLETRKITAPELKLHADGVERAALGT